MKKKIIKTVVIGGTIFALTEISFFAGKGHMLGLLAKYDDHAKCIIKHIANDKRLRMKWIHLIATIEEEL